MSQSFRCEMKAMLQPITEAAIRQRLIKDCYAMLSVGCSDTATLNNLRMDVFSYRYKMADYPDEAMLFNRICSEAFGDSHYNYLDEFGYHVSPVDRMNWCIFVAGILNSQMQPENQEKKD